ncbi:MAG: Uncharacterised protein [Porticoccaceae bacterium UBA1117]|nr:MAG: Uncharacterised protein [Porticoccaceae bacterium UBA1117]
MAASSPTVNSSGIATSKVFFSTGRLKVCLLSILSAAREALSRPLPNLSSPSSSCNLGFFLPDLPSGFLAFLANLSSSSFGLSCLRALSCTGSVATIGICLVVLPAFLASSLASTEAASAAFRASSASLSSAFCSATLSTSSAALRRFKIPAIRCSSTLSVPELLLAGTAASGATASEVTASAAAASAAACASNSASCWAASSASSRALTSLSRSTCACNSSSLRFT